MVRVVDEVLILLGVDAKKFKSGLADASSAGKAFVDRMQKQSQALSAIQILSFAAQTKAVKDFAATGARVEALRNTFFRLAGSIENGNKVLEDTRRITKALSEEDTLKAANMLDLLGIGIDKLPKFIEIARAAAIGLGEDIGFMLQSLTTGAARESILRLDNLGIKMGTADEIAENYARTLGKTAKELTATEESAAFLNTVLERGDEIIAKVGNTTDLAQERFGELNAQMADLRAEVGIALLPVLSDLIRAVTPTIIKVTEWVTANQSLVAAIVGGGVAGGGLIAAIGALGLVLTTFATAGGPIVLAIIGISALVGLLIKLKLAAGEIPTGVDAITAALETERKKLAELETQIEGMAEPFSIFALGSKKNDLRDEAEKTKERIALLEAELAKIPKAVDTAFVGPPSPSPLEKKTEKEIKALQKLQEWKERVGLAPSTTPTLESMDIEAAGPRDLEGDAMVQLFRAREAVLGDYLDTVRETNAGIAESEADLLARQLEGAELHHEAIAQKTVDIAFLWGDMFGQVLEAENNFLKAFGKSMVLTLVKVFGMVAKEAIAEVIVDKVKELGKAAIRAPLSFGASLAATGPIIAAAAAAIGLLGAMEGKLAKSMGGFETGGVVPKTGHFLMHEGEVVFNPQRNTTAQLAANLARAGAVNEAAAIRGGGSGMVNNFWGDIRSQADVLAALKAADRRRQRAMGTGV